MGVCRPCEILEAEPLALKGLLPIGTQNADGLAKPADLEEDARTAAGLILRTAGYVSPKEAAGKPVDCASDQFSLGQGSRF